MNRTAADLHLVHGAAVAGYADCIGEAAQGSKVSAVASIAAHNAASVYNSPANRKVHDPSAVTAAQILAFSAVAAADLARNLQRSSLDDDCAASAAPASIFLPFVLAYAFSAVTAPDTVGNHPAAYHCERAGISSGLACLPLAGRTAMCPAAAANSRASAASCGANRTGTKLLTVYSQRVSVKQFDCSLIASCTCRQCAAVREDKLNIVVLEGKVGRIHATLYNIPIVCEYCSRIFDGGG
ncbi:hypothetical protein SDC9_102971 [bioreactor metagenome]|uniref:Uncharacterized protein n=1 Tax=bioreactor metagenome TaxID=1076179 RepID=A0A645ASW9_9ZZZZ